MILYKRNNLKWNSRLDAAWCNFVQAAACISSFLLYNAYMKDCSLLRYTLDGENLNVTLLIGAQKF